MSYFTVGWMRRGCNSPWGLTKEHLSRDLKKTLCGLTIPKHATPDDTSGFCDHCDKIAESEEKAKSKAPPRVTLHQKAQQVHAWCAREYGRYNEFEFILAAQCSPWELTETQSKRAYKIIAKKDYKQQ